MPAQLGLGAVLPGAPSLFARPQLPRPRADTTSTCVPGVGAGSPGQLGGKGAEQVEEGPGEDDDVVDVQIGLDDHRRQANALCGAGSNKGVPETSVSLGAAHRAGRTEATETPRGSFTGLRGPLLLIFLSKKSR